MPEARGYGALAAIPGSVLYLGGGNGTSWMSSVLRYDIAANTWSRVGALPPNHGTSHLASITGGPGAQLCQPRSAPIELSGAGTIGKTKKYG